MKHRISPATVIATVALFFSLGGAGMAATGYRITSLWQISPKVRHALQGATGPQGAPGIPGPQGPAGPGGPTGTPAQPLFRIFYGPETELSSGSPETLAEATCPDNSWAPLGGGFHGENEIVTRVGITQAEAYGAQAHLEAGQTTGNVSAWVLCEQG